MRTLKYFWLKRVNLFIGLFLVIPMPSLIYAWLTGGLALDVPSRFDLLSEWSNPGVLAFPLVVAIIGFIIGVITLLFVLLRCDLDQVLPLNGDLIETGDNAKR